MCGVRRPPRARRPQSKFRVMPSRRASQYRWVSGWRPVSQMTPKQAPALQALTAATRGARSAHQRSRNPTCTKARWPPPARQRPRSRGTRESNHPWPRPFPRDGSVRRPSGPHYGVLHPTAPMRPLTTSCVLLGLFATPAASQVPAPLTDMVRRVFATNEFGARQRFGPVQWTEGGSAYLTVEPSKDSSGGRDIVRYQTATGARSVFVAAADLVPAGQKSPLDIEGYTVSAEGRQVLIFTNSERVWRDNTRGDYWLLDRTTRALKQLGGPGAPPSSLMYAKLAPTGDRVAYVRGGEIYVEHLASGAVTR